MAEEHPNYLKIDYDFWERIRRRLTTAQQAKLALAMINYFFYGIDPDDMSLPTPVLDKLDGEMAFLRHYRENSIKGAQNRRAKESKGK